MKPQEIKRVNSVFAMIDTADVVQIDNGPLLNSWDTDGVSGERENEILNFSWHDDEGLMYNCKIDEGGLLDACVIDGHIRCFDTEGEPTDIRVFELKDKKTHLSLGKCSWRTVMSGRTRSGNVTCGADVLLHEAGCGYYYAWDRKADFPTKCPHCARPIEPKGASHDN